MKKIKNYQELIEKIDQERKSHNKKINSLYWKGLGKGILGFILMGIFILVIIALFFFLCFLLCVLLCFLWEYIFDGLSDNIIILFAMILSVSVIILSLWLLKRPIKKLIGKIVNWIFNPFEKSCNRIESLEYRRDTEIQQLIVDTVLSVFIKAAKIAANRYGQKLSNEEINDLEILCDCTEKGNLFSDDTLHEIFIGKTNLILKSHTDFFLISMKVEPQKYKDFNRKDGFFVTCNVEESDYICKSHLIYIK